jgi:hypothetical protein
MRTQVLGSIWNHGLQANQAALVSLATLRRIGALADIRLRLTASSG